MSDVKELTNNSNNYGTCVVCYKNVQIYSIGKCDHPVCHECSTRMRVLCQQNECPICRQNLPTVVFTKNIKPFRHLRKGSLVDTRYSIYFDDVDIQERFTELLTHTCTLCKDRQVFSNFISLKDHMRRKHELHYCDLCVKNLRIFSSERRCYSRADLAQHRRKGDKDDKSHKGHPLCEFCDCRYMDNDELFRHLRRDHLFCHICDADGLHQYYNSYNYLQDHFRQEHFLCEEGTCGEEEFTSVFRSDIDLKIHKANVHGKHLGKAAQKQARLLELEFTLAPRGDNRNGGRRPMQGASGNNSTNSRGNNDYGGGGGGMHSRDYNQSELDNAYSIEPEIISMRQPDVQSTEEFPSLGNASAPTVPNLNVTKTKGRGNLTIRGSLKPQNLAIDDENFPALGPETSANAGLSKTVNFSVYSSNKSGPSGLQRPQSATPNVSIQVNHKTDGSITTRVSGPNIRIRPSQLSMDSDFPALGPSESPRNSVNNSNIGQWTKVTCVKPSATKTKKIASPPKFDSPPPPPTAPTSFSEAFPSLPKSTKSKKQASISVTSKNNTYSSTWNQPTAAASTAVVSNDKNITNDTTKGNTKKKKKKKVKPNSSGNNSSGNESSTSKSNLNTTKVQNHNEPSDESITDTSNKRKNDRQDTVDHWSDDITASTQINESIKMNNDSDVPRKRSELKIDNLNISTNGRAKKFDDFPALGKSSSKTTTKVNPPPGFNTVTPPPPPPGFAVKLNKTVGLDTNDNGLTFTNSSGESYSILPDKQNKTYSYVAPPDFTKRNQNLVAKIREVLGLQESIEEFRHLSGLFRQGACTAEDYYKRCRNTMGLSEFANVFPEMLVLLPDIDKQRELFDLHRKEVNDKITSLEVCPTCGQIVKTGNDIKAHYSSHTLENDFPALGEAMGMSSSNTWIRKGT